MKSNEGQTSHGYLRGVLVDGARPFLYRSGVRSLLGIPDDGGGKLTFSPVLPPVGFRYANHQFADEPYITQYYPREAGEFQYTAPGNIRQNTPLAPESVKNLNIGMPEQKGSRSDNNILIDEDRQSKTRSLSKQEKISVDPAKEPEKPSGVIERGKIEIPGVSERSRHFPALSYLKKSDNQTDKAESPYQEEVLQPNPQKEFLREFLSKKQENRSAIDPVTDPLYTSGKLQKKNTVKENLVINPSTDAPENPVPYDVKTAPKYKFPQRTTSVDNKKESSLSAYQTPDPSRHFGSSMVSRSNRDTAERIEQLRRSVRELTTKVSSQETKTDNETRESGTRQTPPPPAQQVVIVRRSSNQTKIPHAFWERSYLSRFHLRTLR